MALTVLGTTASLNQVVSAEEQPAVAESTTTSSLSESLSSTTTASTTTTTTSSSTTSSEVAPKKTVPKLLGVENKKIAVTQSFDPKVGVTATDEKEGDLTSKITISGKVDSQKVGEYPLTYSVKNSEGIETKKAIVISVQAATLEEYKVEISDFTLPKNTTFSTEIQQRMVIKDKDNKNVPSTGAVVTVDGEQKASKLGVVPVNFTVKLANGATIKHTVKVTVKSGIRVVTPKEEYTYHGSKYEDGIDLMNYIEAYEMTSQGKETRMTAYNSATKSGIEVIKSDLDVSVPGRYSIVYRLTNSLGEVVEHTSTVTVIKQKETIRPTVKVEDKTLYVGDRLTEDIVLDWAKTENAEQISFEVIDGEIEVSRTTDQLLRAGTYKIRFTASRRDEMTDAELTAQADMVLTVKAKETTATSTPTTTETTGLNGGTTTQKVAPKQAAATPTKAKTLPKTGSEKGNVVLIISGVALVLGSLAIVIKNYRATK